MTNPARHERQELCDLLLDTGPDAPTLCEGWNTRDLAAHLVVRESRPDAAGGILIKRLAPYGDRVRDKVASRDWESLVSTVRNGPPKLSPMRIPALDRLTNTLEFFVHLEDVRRAQPGWSPRNLPTDLEATLLDALRRGGRLIARRAPCGLTATPSGHGTFTLRKGSPTVDIAGDIGEIVLYLYGRSAHARVELTGPAESVAAVSATRFGV